MKEIVGHADRIRELQVANIDALFECEKKMAEDENVVRMRSIGSSSSSSDIQAVYLSGVSVCSVLSLNPHALLLIAL